MSASGGRTLSAVLAWNVRRHRRAVGLTQQDVADRMHALGHATWTHQTTTSKVEGRIRAVTVDELAGLALALEVSPVDLLGPDPDGPSLSLGLHPIAEAFGQISAPAWFAGDQDVRVAWDGNRATGLRVDRRSRGREDETT